ncbi:hypothetical protein Bca4012_058517 [Brassica carinata]
MSDTLMEVKLWRRKDAGLCLKAVLSLMSRPLSTFLQDSKEQGEISSQFSEQKHSRRIIDFHKTDQTIVPPWLCHELPNLGK